jgi:hypothetical protein
MTNKSVKDPNTFDAKILIILNRDGKIQSEQIKAESKGRSWRWENLIQTDQARPEGKITDGFGLTEVHVWLMMWF